MSALAGTPRGWGLRPALFWLSLPSHPTAGRGIAVARTLC